MTARASTALLSVLGLSFGLAVVACDKPAEAPATEAPAATTESPVDAGDAAPEAAAAEEDAGPKAWADMSFDERKKVMGTEYYPAMKEAFQAHDASAFAEFTCKTCHGENAKDVNFEMPADLTPLPTENTIQAANDMDEAVSKFMQETVVPKTAEILGAPAWSPDTPEGIGCFTCHPQG